MGKRKNKPTESTATPTESKAEPTKTMATASKPSHDDLDARVAAAVNTAVEAAVARMQPVLVTEVAGNYSGCATHWVSLPVVPGFVLPIATLGGNLQGVDLSKADQKLVGIKFTTYTRLSSLWVFPRQV